MDTNDSDNGSINEDALYRFVAEQLAWHLTDDGVEADPHTIERLEIALKNNQVAGALQQMFNPEARKKALAPACVEAVGATVRKEASRLHWITAGMLQHQVREDNAFRLQEYLNDFEARLTCLETREHERSRDEAAARLAEATARAEADAREEAKAEAIAEELRALRKERERWSSR